MSRSPWRALSIVVILVGCVVSVAMTLQTLRETPRRKAVLADKLQRLEALDRIAAGGGDDAPARQALASLADKVPPDLDELMGAALPEANISIRREDAQLLDQSWFLRPVEVRISDVPLDQLWPAIERCENARPPWRVIECSLESTPDAPGTVTATLRLEALHKEEI